MSLLGAALAVSLLVGDPAPSAPLADLVAAERARNAALPPREPPLPERFAPRLRDMVKRRGDDGSTCCIYKLPRPVKVDGVDDPEYPAMLFHMAIDADERSRYDREEAAYLAQDIAHRPHKAAELLPRRAGLLVAAKESSERMIELLKVLVTTPQLAHSPLREEGHYLYILELGALVRLGEQQDAEQEFVRLYPRSAYQPHLDIVAGHRALARRELSVARARYRRVLASAARELHAHAHVGLGWSYLRAEAGEGPRSDLALAAFTRAFELAVTDDLLASADDGLVHAFAGAGRAAGAARLFDRLAARSQPAARRSIALQERLALVYFARGQIEESRQVYVALQRRHPDDPGRCTWQQGVVRIAAAVGDPDATLREAVNLGEVWQGIRGGVLPDAVRRRCRDDALGNLMALARHWELVADQPRADQACAAVARLFPRDGDTLKLPCIAARYR